jgi:hypothetical protein
MNDDTGALLDHCGNHAAIQPHSRIQVLIDILLAEFIRDSLESPAGRG